jgi:hypothetical protein
VGNTKGLGVGDRKAATGCVLHRLAIDLIPIAFAGPHPTGVMATSTTPITASVTTDTSTPARICLDRGAISIEENLP